MQKIKKHVNVEAVHTHTHTHTHTNSLGKNIKINKEINIKYKKIKGK